MKAQRMMKILGCGLLNLAFFAVPIITLAQPPQDNPDKWEQIKAQKKLLTSVQSSS